MPFTDNTNTIILEIEDSSAIDAVKRTNTGLDSVDKKAASASKSASQSFSQMGDTVVRTMDRSRSSIERLVAQAEKKAASLGASPLQRLTADRNQALSRVAGDPEAIQRITAAYDKMAGATENVSGGLKGMIFNAAAAYATFETLKTILKDVILDSALYAARTEQLGVALEAVGKANRISTGTLAVTEEQLKKIGITTQDARESMARLVAAHIDLGKASELARASQDLSRIAGITSSEAFEKLTHAIVTQQPELLRMLGLNVNLQREFELFAKKTNRSAQDLSELEKRQVTVNAVLQAAGAYTGVYAKSLDTAGGQILSFKRYIIEAKNSLGNEFLPLLTAVVGGMNAFGKDTEGTTRTLKGMIYTVPIVGALFLSLNEAIRQTNQSRDEASGRTEKYIKDSAKSLAIDKLNEGVAAARAKEEERFAALQQKTAEVGIKQKEAALSAEEKARAFREESVGAEIGGVAKVIQERARLVRESSRILFDGQKYDVKLSSQALADINAGTQAKIRAEVRKTEEEIRAERAKTSDLIISNEKTNVQSRQELAIAGYQNAFAREVLDRRTVENERLALHKETLDKIAALDKQLIEDQTAREIEKIRTDEQRKGTDPARIRALVGERQSQANEKELQIARALNDAKNKAEQELQTERIERDRAYSERRKDYEFETQVQLYDAQKRGLDQSHELQLEQLGLYQNTSLRQKLAVEQARLAIEVDYIRKSQEIQDAALKDRQARDLEKIREDVDRGGISESEAVAQRIAVEARYQDERKRISADTNSEITIANTRAQVQQFDAIRSVYMETKQSIEGLLDQMLSRTKSWGDIMKSIFKAAILQPIKEAAASYIASLLTGVRIAASGGSATQSTGGTSTGGLFGGLLGGLLGGARGGGGFSIPGAPGGTGGFAGPVTSGGALLGGLPLAFGGFGGITGPGGTGGFAGPVQQSGIGGAVQSAGLLGGLKAQGSGLLGMLRGLGNLGFGPKGGDYGGEVEGSYSGVGGVTGGAMLLGGSALAFDGLRRGGKLGLAETTAGGALIGWKFGGPVGALIGGAIGFTAGFVRLFIKGAQEKLQAKIKSMYGVDIQDKGLLKSIMDTIKSQYAGNLDVGLASPQIRDLIELYAMSTGQGDKFPVQNKMRPLFLNQVGGNLFQAPTFENGRSIGMSGGLPFLNSVDRLVAPAGSSTGSMNVTVQLDGAATTSVLRGEAVNVMVDSPQVVSAANVSGQQASSGRRESAALNFGVVGLVTA